MGQMKHIRSPNDDHDRNPLIICLSGLVREGLAIPAWFFCCLGSVNEAASDDLKPSWTVTLSSVSEILFSMTCMRGQSFLMWQICEATDQMAACLAVVPEQHLFGTADCIKFSICVPDADLDDSALPKGMHVLLLCHM